MVAFDTLGGVDPKVWITLGGCPDELMLLRDPGLNSARRACQIVLSGGIAGTVAERFCRVAAVHHPSLCPRIKAMLALYSDARSPYRFVDLELNS